MEKIRIPNNKGKHLSTVIHRPNKETDKLAILCPGFLDTKDYAHLIALAEGLANRGYTVVRFDPTGTWESEGDISEYSNSQYLLDIKNVLDHMLREKEYKDILVAGHSRGGMISILYAARDLMVSQVLAIMPSSPHNLKAGKYATWKERGYHSSFRDIPNSSEKREFKLPYSHVEDMEKFNVFDDVKKTHARIILVAGELDEVCLPENVKQVFDLANEPKKYILIKGIGHDYRHNPREIDLVNNQIFALI